MKFINWYVVGFFILVATFVFSPFFFFGKIPLPADALVGLYHPFRDAYIESFPQGMPFKNFLITDPIRQQYPFRFLAVGDLAVGQLPLWNPYNFAGTPLLANIQSAPFYPLNVLFLILPFSTSWAVLVFLQPILAGIFTYLYLRKIGSSTLGGLLGGVSFAFSGFSIAWMEWNTILHTALWLPLVLLTVENLFRKMTFKWSFIFVFAFSAQILAGHTQTAFYLSFFTIAYIFLKSILFLRKDKQIALVSFKKIIFFPALLLLSFAATFIQWFPALQFINYSARDVDLVYWQIEGWFIPYQHLIQFVVPDFFGNPTTLNYWGVWNYAEMNGYVGIVSLVFAFFALLFVKRRIVWFLAVVIITCLVFSLPNPVSLLPFTLSIPFLETAQPTRLLFLIDFSLAVLAGIGISRLQKNRQGFFMPLFIVGIFLGTIWLMMLFNFPFSTSNENLLVSRRNLILPSALFGAVVLIYLSSFIVKRKRFIVVIPFVFLLLASFDLTRSAVKFLPFTDQAYVYPETSSIRFLQNNQGYFRSLSVDDRILPPNTSIMYGLQTVEGYDPLYLRRYGELIVAAERNQPSFGQPWGFNRIITPSNFESRIYELMGVKYIISLGNLSSDKLKKVYSEGSTIIYENLNVSPRAFAVESIISADNSDEALRIMFDDDISLVTSAVVENYSGKSSFQQAEVRILDYSNNNVKLSVESSGDAFVVLTDSYYPTWRAAVIDENGRIEKELEIYRVDYNFRGVLVPQGAKSVLFYNNLF